MPGGTMIQITASQGGNVRIHTCGYRNLCKVHFRHLWTSCMETYTVKITKIKPNLYSVSRISDTISEESVLSYQEKYCVRWKTTTMAYPYYNMTTQTLL